MSLIRLQSSDGDIFNIDEKIARLSGTINKSLEDYGFDDGADNIVPLANVNTRILRKVLQWAEYHKNDQDDEKKKKTDDILPWDVEFLSVDQGTLFDLILAANYLDIKGLMYIAAKSVANMVKGKSPDEIRRTFYIKNDFTAEEEKQHYQENRWVDEKETVDNSNCECK